MIKYNLNNINDWNYGNDNIKKVYYHNSICYQKISKGEGETYNLFGKTKSGSPFTIKLNGVDETVTIVKDNGDGTYDWGLKYSNPITDTTSMCSGNTNLLSFDWGDADVSNLTSISGYVFYNCISLTSVTIPNSVTSIGNGAFAQCRSLSNVIIPSSVTNIGNSAFAACDILTSVTIPNSVTSIGNEAFSHCTSLTNITIPNSVTSIGNQAFYRCGNLSTITIGSGVKSIGANIFYECTSLTSITIPSSVTWIASQAFYHCENLSTITVEATTPPRLDMRAFDYTNDCPIYVPAASVNTYKSTYGWSTYASRIQAIPIKYKLVAAYVDGHIESAECSSQSETIEEVNDKTNIVDLQIGQCVTGFGNDFIMVMGFPKLSSITVDSENTVFDSRDNCNAIIETNTNILYRGCKNTIIPSGVTSILAYAFCGCTGLTSITIPNTVTSIDWSSFLGCSGLTSINIPDSVTRIGHSAFCNCSGLTSVTIGNSVTSIEPCAFIGCDSLTSITINATAPPQISTDAFVSTNNYPIYVPAESVDAYKASRGWSDLSDRIFPIQ